MTSYHVDEKTHVDGEGKYELTIKWRELVRKVRNSYEEREVVIKKKMS
jgi:hypothetical protein